MIHYTDTITTISPQQLGGFFVGWPNPPSPDMHWRILQQSYRIWLALDDETHQVVGFINAVSDGLLSAYIPLLEVLPHYQKRGIGMELTKRMIDSLDHLYAIDLLCDVDVQPFYEKMGMQRASGMLVRHYHNQSGSDALG